MRLRRFDSAMTSDDEFLINLARRKGLLTDADVAAAESECAGEAADADIDADEPRDVMTIVADRGVVSPAQWVDLLAEEFAMPVVQLDGQRVGGDALSWVTAEQARHYGVFPLGQDGDVLRVAISDPLAIQSHDELGNLLQLTLETCLATPEEIRRAIDRHYGESGTGDVVEEPSETGAGDAPSSNDPESDADNDAPVIRMVYGIIAEAVRQRASDIHLEPLAGRFRVRYRIDGRLREVEGPAKRLQLPLISRVKIMADLSIAEKRLPQDGRIQVKLAGKPIDLRVSTVPTTHGESIVMRILDQDGLKLGLGELGMLAEDETTLRRLIGLADGMVLVTGPTGSGKTTTLYSCLHHLNQPNRKIITVEDPVEYQLAGINQVPVRSEVGLTFSAALRAMLRQAPNVVMVGEIRDRETAEIAINASQTGHLVFSTLHTNDAPSAITRLSDLGVPSFLVASSLRAVVAQRLVRRICPECTREQPATAAEKRWAESCGLAARETYCRGEGCPDCQGTGYHGRVAIFEFFIVDEDLERMIHNHAGLSQLRTAARSRGMATLRADGLRKAAQGLTTVDEVIAATVSDPIDSPASLATAR